MVKINGSDKLKLWELKNLKKTIRKTAELLSEAYGIDEDFTFEILIETFEPVISKGPERTITDGEPLLPDELSIYFKPSLYDALRDLTVDEVLKLFEDKKKRNELKQLEIDFKAMKVNCPLIDFKYVADCLPDFRIHLYQSRRSLRHRAKTKNSFKKCGILDQFFTRGFPENSALPHRFDRDSVNGRQSLYAKVFYDFKMENPSQGEHFGYKKHNDEIVEYGSSLHFISLPPLPFVPENLRLENITTLKKERFGNFMTFIRLKDQMIFYRAENPTFDMDSFIKKLKIYRDFLLKPNTLKNEEDLRRSLDDFVRKFSRDLTKILLSPDSKTHATKFFVQCLFDHPVKKFIKTIFDHDFQVWNLPKDLVSSDLSYDEDRLHRILKFLSFVEIENETRAISKIQKILEAPWSSKYSNEDGVCFYFKTSLYRALGDIKESDPRGKISIDGAIDIIEEATKIYNEHKSQFEKDFTRIDSSDLQAVLNKVPEAGYEFGSGFRSFKNYEKNLEISFTKQQAKIVELLITNKHDSPENSLGTYQILEKLYSEKDCANKIKRIHSESPFRVETEIFSLKHTAITSRLIRRGYSKKSEKLNRKERTYFIDPLFSCPDELPEQFDLKEWVKKDNQKNKKPKKSLDRQIPKKHKKALK